MIVLDFEKIAVKGDIGRFFQITGATFDGDVSKGDIVKVFKYKIELLYPYCIFKNITTKNKRGFSLNEDTEIVEHIPEEKRLSCNWCGGDILTKSLIHCSDFCKAELRSCV